MFPTNSSAGGRLSTSIWKLNSGNLHHCCCWMHCAPPCKQAKDLQCETLDNTGHPTCLVFSVLKAQIDHLRPHKDHQTNTQKRNFKVQQHSSNFPMIIFMLKGIPCHKLSLFCSVCLQVLPVCLSGSCVLLSGGTSIDKLGWLRILEPG